MNKSCHIVRCKSICCVTKNADGVLDHFYEFPWFSPILGNVNICTQVLHKKISSNGRLNPLFLLLPILHQSWQVVVRCKNVDNWYSAKTSAIFSPLKDVFDKKLLFFCVSNNVHLSWRYLDNFWESIKMNERIYLWSQKITLLRNEKNQTPFWRKESDKDSFANLVR